MAERTCSIEGCDRQHSSRGWCVVHYEHWWKYGHPLDGEFQPANDAERFWSKVNKSGDCWLWTAGTWRSRGQSLYGQFVADGRKIGAHRFAYQLVFGAIPLDTQVDHRCHNTLCVRPEHLRLATNKQNHENRRGPTSRSRSGVLGVSWNRRRQKWVASVGHNGKLWSARFDTKEQAAAAVQAKRLELFSHNDLDRQ